MIGLSALFTSCITPAASCPTAASRRSRARGLLQREQLVRALLHHALEALRFRLHALLEARALGDVALDGDGAAYALVRIVQRVGVHLDHRGLATAPRPRASRRARARRAARAPWGARARTASCRRACAGGRAARARAASADCRARAPAAPARWCAPCRPRRPPRAPSRGARRRSTRAGRRCARGPRAALRAR